MKKGLKIEVGKPILVGVAILTLGLVAWYGWHTLNPGPPDGRAISDEAARYQAAHGIDIKTVPTWSDMWYKYHPEYKGPHPPVKMPEVNVPGPPGTTGVPGAPGATEKPGTTPVIPETPDKPASSGAH